MDVAAAAEGERVIDRCNDSMPSDDFNTKLGNTLERCCSLSVPEHRDDNCQRILTERIIVECFYTIGGTSVIENTIRHFPPSE
jgi:hypothetical protein